MSEETKKILVVEDDPSILNLIARALQLEYEVATVSDGTAALHQLPQFRPDLVLLDVNLPGMDGFSIAQRMKGSPEFKTVPIIFLTARDRPSDTIRGIQVGARHYLTKPFKLEELLSKVKKCVG